MDHLADFSIGNVIKIHSSQLQKFKEQAKKNKRKKRYRLCLQESSEGLLQEMIISRCKDDYCRPDKHRGIPESHTILEGSELIVLFDDDGTVTDAFLLDREKGYLTYRINEDIFHMTIPLTETAIDYEVKLGPFQPESNIFPDWAPKEEEKEAVEAFVKKIKAEVKNRI